MRYDTLKTMLAFVACLYLPWTAMATGSDPCDNIIEAEEGVTYNFSFDGTGEWNPANNFGVSPWSTPGQEQVWSYTPDESGTLEVYVTNSGFYVDLLYSTGTCDEGSLTYVDDIFASDDSSYPVEAGTTYYFVLDDENTALSTGTITFEQESEVPGCTDSSACNYDADATEDDMSCVSVGDACDDGNASTFDDVYTDCALADYGCQGTDPCDVPNAFDPPLADATVECLNDLPTECDATQGADRGEVSCVLGSSVSSRTECVATTAMGTGADGAIVLFDIDGDADDDRFFMPTDAGMSLVQYDNGVAVVTGQVADVDDADAILNVNIVYENGVSGADWGGGFKIAQSCTPTSDITDEWMVYILNSGVSFLTGEGSLDGTVLQLSHAPSSEYFGFQVGEMANDRNCNHGAGGWFSYEGMINGEPIQGAQGDVLLDLDCTTTQSTPCADDAATASSVTLHYAAFDEDCGDVIFGEATTVRLDTQAPSFDNAPADVTVNCEDGLPAVPNDLTATDNCEGSDNTPPTVTLSGETPPYEVECTGTYKVDRTFIAEDCSGNQATHIQTITVVDNTAPPITGGDDYTAECDGAGNLAELNGWLNNNGGASATDNCTAVENISWTNDFEGLSDGCGATGTADVTFTATDDCGNSSTVTLTFTIEDTQAPTLTADHVHEVACEDYDPAAIYAASASDMCGGAEVVLVSQTQGSGSCAGTYIHTYKAVDDCENESAEFQQTVNLLDNTAPVITGGADLTVECDGDGNVDALNAWLDSNGGASATDNCDDEFTWSNDFTALSDDCGATGSATVTFTAKDVCDNSSSVTLTFTIEDTTNPSIDTEAEDETVECDGMGNNEDFFAWLADYAGAEASDDCSDILWTNDYGSYQPAAAGFTGSYSAESWTLVEVGNQAELTFSDDGSEMHIQGPVDEQFGPGGGNGLVKACQPARRLLSVSFDWEYTLDTSWPNSGSLADPAFYINDDVHTLDGWNATLFGNGTQNGSMTITVETGDEFGWGIAGLPFGGLGGADLTISNFSTQVLASQDPCQDEQRIVTFKAEDECGNYSLTTASFFIEDTTPPSIDTDASDDTVECDGSGNTEELNAWLNSNGGAAASDVCGNVTWTNDFEGLSDDCGATGSATVIFTATDDCGNASTTSATFTIEDTTAPTWDDYSVYVYAACEDILDPTDPTLVPITASDDCGNVTYSIEAYQLSGGCPGTWMRVWTATDECDNVSETTEQYVQLYDNIKPVPVITCPADYTVDADENCQADLTPAAAGSATATATDNCAAEEDITIVITSVDGPTTAICDGAYFFTRTWTATATDECDNTDDTSCSQLITVEDNTAPIISGGDDATVECDGSGNMAELNAWLGNNAGATATDNCSAVTWTNNFTALSDDCAATGSALVTFTATDDCGNASTTTATFTIEDTTAPTIAGDLMTSIACDDWSCDADALEALGLFTVTEDCGDYTLSIECFATSGSCVTPVPGYNVTIVATDECGNDSDPFMQIIDLYDDVAPVPSITCPADYTTTLDADCNADTSTGAAGMATGSATDNCDAAPEVDVTFSDSAPNYTCMGDDDALEGSYTFTRTFTATATDHCGNTASTTCTQTITVNDEMAPAAPSIDCPADAEVFLDADCMTDASPTATGEAAATSTDNCDSDVAVTINYSDSAPTNTCAGDDGQLDGSYTFVRTWTATATDDCGNTSASSSCEQTITVTDNTAPDFAGSSNEYSIACDLYSAEDQYEVVAADNCDSDVTITILSNNEVSGSCAGSILRTYQAVDDCGNTSTFQQTIDLLDEVDPVVTITCPADQTISSAADCSADTSVDAMGEATFTATDNCDNDLDTDLSHSDVVIEGCNDGTYTIERTWTITAEDHCDNEAMTSCVQTITVQDNDAPVLSGGDGYTAECDGSGNVTELNAWLGNNAGISATDCGDVTWSNNFAGLSDGCGATGTADVTFTATDCRGNSSSSTFTFTIQDTTDPEASADAEVSVPCDQYSDEAEYGNFMASDMCGGVTVIITDIAASGACAGSYMRTYHIEDECGNDIELSQIVNLTDDVAPTFDIACPADVALNSDEDCNADTSEATHGTATYSNVMDNCDDDVQMAVSSDDVITNICDGSYTIARTFTITGTDHCDNVTTKTCTQTITVTDVTAPSIDTDASDLTVECDGAGNAADLAGWLASNGGAAASDNCSAVTWSNSDATLSDLCGATGAVTVTFTATDDCGNSSSTSATFTIEDTTDPSLSITGPANKILEQNESCNVDTSVDAVGNVMATASDACGDASIDITHADGAITFTCTSSDACNSPDAAVEGSYTFVRTFTVTATDACGNASTDTYDQVITVTDNITPQLTNTCDLDNGDAVEVCCEDLSGTVTIPEACTLAATDNCDSEVAICFEEQYVGEYAPTGDVMSYCLSTTPEAFADGEACNGLDPHAFSLFNFDGQPRVDFTSLGAGTVAQMNDGTWVLTQELTNEAGTGTLSLSVTYGAASSWDDFYVPGQTNYKRDCGVLIDDHLNWDYRILQSGTVTGSGIYNTLDLTLAHAPANEYYAMQVGLGANNQNDNYGYSGWVMASGTYNGDAVFFSGDLFGDLDCCLPWSIDREYTATDDCGNATDFAYVIDVNGDDCGDDDGALVSGGQAGDHTPVILGGAGDMTTGKSPIRVTNLQPNPTNDLSMLGFTVNENMRLRVDMFTMDGILVTELFDGVASPNVNHTLDIEADALQSGMYQIRLSSNQYLVVKKLLVTD